MFWRETGEGSFLSGVWCGSWGINEEGEIINEGGEVGEKERRGRSRLPWFHGIWLGGKMGQRWVLTEVVIKRE